jgi:ribosome-associated toxin RatA of RatAB toxin-antitoxin module
MGMAKQRTAAAVTQMLALTLGIAAGAPAADFTLTPAETVKVEARGVVMRSTLDAAQRRGTVRAAVLIDSPPEVAFEMMTSCTEALVYVPHLRVCRVRERAADGSWEIVEHEIDFGWYAPRVKWAFRAEFEPDHAIAFRQVSGDFKTNEGRWEFEPVANGTRTLLRYRATIDPPGFVPNWLARSTYKKELPLMLTNLRKRCEAEQKLRARTSATPR